MSSGITITSGGLDKAVVESQKFTTMFPTTIPVSATFNTTRCGPAGQRQEVEYLSGNGTSYTYANGKMTFDIKSQLILDFKHAYLEFFATCAATGGNAYFSNGIWNLFNRIRVLSGSKVLFEQLGKNYFRSLQWSNVRRGNTDGSLGQFCWGVDTAANRLAKAAGAVYAIPLDIAYLGLDEIPFTNVTNFIIEFYFESPFNCVQFDTATSNPTYTIQNPRIRCHEVQYQEDLMRDIVNLGFIIYPYTNFKYYTFSIPAGANTNQFSINFKTQGMKRIIGVMFNASDINNPLTPDLFTTGFQYNNTTQYQAKIDNTYFPGQPFKSSQISINDPDGAAEAYLSSYRALARRDVAYDVFSKRNNGECPDYYSDAWQPGSDFVSGLFSMAIEFKTFFAHDEFLLSKLDTSGGNTIVQLNMNMANGYPLETQTLMVFVVHSTVVVQWNSGKFDMIE